MKKENELDLSDMRLVDHIAIRLLQGLLSNPKLANTIKQKGGPECGWLEESAYEWARGLLQARLYDLQKEVTK